MDNSEFESRVFANPDDNDQDFLEAIKDNPARQQMLEEVRLLNARIVHTANNIAIPVTLREQLLTRPAEDAASHDVASVTEVRSWQPLRMLALAAALVLAVGLSYSVIFDPNNPTAEELAFGQQVVSHVYGELEEIGLSQGVSAQQVNQTFNIVGGSMPDEQLIGTMRVKFARPCALFPPDASAHLVIEGDRGEINVIIINNSPVAHEFGFQDERFDTVIIPLEHGNLILVGERDEALDTYRSVITDNMEWLI